MYHIDFADIDINKSTKGCLPNSGFLRGSYSSVLTPFFLLSSPLFSLLSLLSSFFSFLISSLHLPITQCHKEKKGDLWDSFLGYSLGNQSFLSFTMLPPTVWLVSSKNVSCFSTDSTKSLCWGKDTPTFPILTLFSPPHHTGGFTEELN